MFPIIALLILIAASPAFAWQVQSFARVPAHTSAMTVNNGAIWCGYIRSDTTIKVIDPADGNVTSMIPAPAADCLGLTLRDGSVWFLGRERLFQLNMRGEVLATLNRPYDHMKGLVVFGEGLWTVVVGEGDAHLVQFHPQAGELRRIDINVFEPGGLGWDGTRFWITEPNGGFIHQLDSTGRTLEIYPTPAFSPRGVTFNGDDFYLVDSGDDEDGDVMYLMSLEAEVTPRLMPSGFYHHYGLVGVRGSLIWNLGLFNVGGRALQVSSIYTVRNDAMLTLGELQLPINIEAGQASIVRASFNPQEYGILHDTIVVVSNDPIKDTIRIAIEGVGVYNDRVLSVSASPIDFGTVRVEPVRDGSRHLDVNFVNEGAFEVTITSVVNRVTEIFALAQPQLPLVIQPADTFVCRIWFTPHRQLQYVDTLVIQSDALSPFVEAILLGRGIDDDVPAGNVLWERQLQASPSSSGATAVHSDLNRDAIREVVGVGADGHVVCINGFASGSADIIWEQSFEGAAYDPAGIISTDALQAGVLLGGNPKGSVIFGSGSPDGAVYCLDGATGTFLWRWDASSSEAGDRVEKVIAGEDFEGDGTFDPVVLANDETGAGAVVRLEGQTGSVVWIEHFDSQSLLEISPDLNGDGLGDCVIASANSIRILSGADGTLIHQLQGLQGVSTIQPLGRIGEGMGPLLLVGLNQGGVTVLDLAAEREVWHLTESPNAGQLDTVKLVRYYSGLGGPLLAIGDVEGRIVVVDNPSDGHILYDIPSNARLTSLNWTMPDDRSGSFNLIVGYANGRVIGYDGSDSLWSWVGEAPEGGEAPQVLDVIGYQDIDFGGSKDVIARTADGFVRCLSSGGNLAVWGSSEVLPSDPGIALYPNPFNGVALLSIHLPTPSPVSVEVFDLVGRSLGRRELGLQPAGQLMVEFNELSEVSAGGTLFFRVETNQGLRVLSGSYVK